MIPSKSEFRRLIDQGAITTADKERITDPFHKIESTEVFKIGKHTFIKVVLEE
jgi:tyrosyl-tRNA synthetase